MGTRTPLAPKELYHLYNRGTEKRKIFDSRADYERFLALLYLSNSIEPVHINNQRYRGSTLVERLELERGEQLVSIAAYCLMPNHFHLLVQEHEEGGISKFMQKLVTGYTMYYNTKNERTGALFQGKFKSEHAGDDRYLKYLLAYIHLNPSKFSKPEQYIYSSYADFAGEKRLQGKILDIKVLPDYFPSSKDFKKEMQQWLHYRTEVEPW